MHRLRSSGQISWSQRLQDRELRLLDLVRRDWWALVIAACVVWAIECQLEGKSAFETLAGPVLILAWGAAGLLLDTVDRDVSPPGSQ
jgi:hypothetical protein